MDLYTIIITLGIIFCHWVFDFVFQDEKWALGKSKSIKCLLMHTITYSALWWFPILTIFTVGYIYPGTPLDNLNWYIIGLFPLITFVFHTLTDYITSKIVSKRFADGYYGGPIPNFGGFAIIGFDQVLHYIQLFLTYYILVTWA
jgi:hypothetical protein